MNAKKLEIDFDGDDFFNSFDPSAKPIPEKPKETIKPVEKETKPDRDSGSLKFGQNLTRDDKAKTSVFGEHESEDLTKPDLPTPTTTTNKDNKASSYTAPGVSNTDDDV